MSIGATPPMPSGAAVSLCLLGSVRLFRNGEPLTLRPGGKSEQLLGQLALYARESVSRDALVTTIWPDADGSLAGQALDTLVHAVRRRLADALGGQPPILVRDGRYALNRDAGFVTDLVQFDDAAADGDRSTLMGDTRRALEHYTTAVALYAGDLAFGSDIVALVERERLRARYLTALSRLADAAFATGALEPALDHAYRLLAHDACREDAHRIVMRCLVRLGYRSQALRQYRVCRDALAIEFDAGPEPATEALYELVRTDPSAV